MLTYNSSSPCGICGVDRDRSVVGDGTFMQSNRTSRAWGMLYKGTLYPLCLGGEATCGIREDDGIGWSQCVKSASVRGTTQSVRCNT